jgi:hypothetical protein
MLELVYQSIKLIRAELTISMEKILKQLAKTADHNWKQHKATGSEYNEGYADGISHAVRVLTAALEESKSH